jgi:hypothetical protein
VRPELLQKRYSSATNGGWSTIRLHDGRTFYVYRDRVFVLREVPATRSFPRSSRSLVEVGPPAQRSLLTIARRSAVPGARAVPLPPGMLVLHQAWPRAVGDRFDMSVPHRDSTALLSADPAPVIVTLYSRDCIGCADDLAVLPKIVDRAQRSRMRVVIVARSDDDPERLRRSIDKRVRDRVTIVPDRSWSVFAGLDARYVPITFIVRHGRISRMVLGSITAERLPGVLEDVGRT